MKRRQPRGQATTEFAMIAGLITVCSLFIIALTYGPLRSELRSLTECVMGDVCQSAPPGGIVPDPLNPGGGGGGAGGGRGGGGTLGDVPDVCPTGPFPDDCSAFGRAFEEAKCIVKGGASGDLWDYMPRPPFGAATPSFEFGSRAYWAYQNCKAIRKRQACACGECEECDGRLTWHAGTRISCVHNDTDGLVSDLAESGAMIHDTTRMIDGEAPHITENAAINRMKEQITRALRETGSSERVELLGHSQGSAILANALWQLRREGALKATDWERLDVVVIGAAENRYPPELGQITAYSVDGEGPNPFDGDAVDAIGETRELLNSGKVATVLPIRVQENNSLGIPVEPCTDSAIYGCHAASRYLKYHAALQRRMGEPPPARTVMVNGQLNKFEEWNGPSFQQDGVWKPGMCDLYGELRYRSES